MYTPVQCNYGWVFWSCNCSIIICCDTCRSWKVFVVPTILYMEYVCIATGLATAMPIYAEKQQGVLHYMYTCISFLLIL